jgi:RNA polymerase sigma factor (sigma-70 family)
VVYTIGLRLAFNERRRRTRWRRGRPSAEATWAIASDPDLWRALARLDLRVRAALVLNVLDGYTQSEVGSLLGVPASTAGSWLSRAKSQLRESLKEVG